MICPRNGGKSVINVENTEGRLIDLDHGRLTSKTRKTVNSLDDCDEMEIMDAMATVLRLYLKQENVIIDDAVVYLLLGMFKDNTKNASCYLLECIKRLGRLPKTESKYSLTDLGWDVEVCSVLSIWLCILISFYRFRNGPILLHALAAEV